eukprot:TRINITY_DN6313_c0_g1_i1.p1 TRINITY_DN6313_c0_g1~~TRINITY_DN6313_c0_g1_i1.p1  ORF type:complete len:100 (-),score=24.61 TRINITY_DN6313_c0_g1_i1:135-434(-)
MACCGKRPKPEQKEQPAINPIPQPELPPPPPPPPVLDAPDEQVWLNLQQVPELPPLVASEKRSTGYRPRVPRRKEHFVDFEPFDGEAISITYKGFVEPR